MLVPTGTWEVNWIFGTIAHMNKPVHFQRDEHPTKQSQAAQGRLFIPQLRHSAAIIYLKVTNCNPGFNSVHKAAFCWGRVYSARFLIPCE